MQYPIGETIERFRFGVALHVGKNPVRQQSAAANRLDFTCIGPAVNLAARLEKKSPARLHRTIVASEAFVGLCAGGWSDLGEFSDCRFCQGRARLWPGGRDLAGSLNLPG